MTGQPLKDWMWVYARGIIAESEASGQRFLQPRAAIDDRLRWEAPVDVFETAEELLVVVAMPGVDVDTLRVALDDGQLFIAGERRLALPAGALLLRLEIPHGIFERRLRLPPGSYDLGDTRMCDGCLYISIHKPC